MTKNEALKLALVALEESQTDNDTMEFWDRKIKATTALREALAQPEQEPVARVAEVHMSRYTLEWTNGPLPEGTELFSPAAQRPWVGLTDDEIFRADPRIGTSDSNVNPYQILINARTIEAMLKERNNG